MLCVGVDFGSTYSLVSEFDQEDEKLNMIQLAQGGSPYIPSVLARQDGETHIGQDAKNMVGMFDEDLQWYKAFKMLLTESDPQLLKARGYDEENTPSAVTAEFLRVMLEKALDRIGETAIGRLVVGVPEIWNSALQTVDARAELKRICSELPFVSKRPDGTADVEIVSEPAAASAYYSYYYRQQTGHDFCGKILLIDYGGGTLDITLTDVESRPDKAGNSAMEIRVLKRTGAGENEDRMVGKAGIAYMEELTKAAIQRALPGEEIPEDQDFFAAVDALEQKIQYSTGTIAKIIQTYGTSPVYELLPELMQKKKTFAVIFYNGMKVEITYQLLAQVYDRVIRTVLNEKLDEVIAYMEANHIPYDGRSDDMFKLVTVGGFGKFAFVRKQVERKFRVSSNDRRLQCVFSGQTAGEQAISMGAALLSAGVIRIRNTAPYSIGISPRQGVRRASYGLQMNQDVEIDKVYLQRGDSGRPVPFAAKGGGFERFVINMQDDPAAAKPLKPRPEFLEKLMGAFEDTGKDGGVGYYVPGFSMDASGIITVHIYDYDVMTQETGRRLRSIELSSFRNLFDISAFGKVGYNG